MKKTIASMAMLVSASTAMATPAPQNPGDPGVYLKTICLQINRPESDGSPRVSSCDLSERNRSSGVELKENGCAEGQVAIQTYRDLAISSCMPPAPAQL